MSESPEQILNVAASPVTVVRQEHIILALQKMLLRDMVDLRMEAWVPAFRQMKFGRSPTQEEADEARALFRAELAREFDELVLQIARGTS